MERKPDRIRSRLLGEREEDRFHSWVFPLLTIIFNGFFHPPSIAEKRKLDHLLSTCQKKSSNMSKYLLVSKSVFWQTIVVDAALWATVDLHAEQAR